MTTEPIDNIGFTADNTASQNADDWKTVASLGAVDYGELPSSTHWLWFSCTAQNSGDNTTRVRVFDAAASEGVVEASITGSEAQTFAAAPASTGASALSQYEFQLRAGAGTASLADGERVNVWVGER